MEKIIYTFGEKIGMCYYLSDEPSIGSGRKSIRHAKFRCACGKIIIKSISDMKTGRVSCGCARGKAHTRHGYAKAGNTLTEYTTWLNIKRRCCIPTSIQYKDYGGRGIMVCERWVNSFDNFIKDMGRKPTPKHSIERINNNGNYEPLNCKWATRTEQARNKSKNVYLEFNNERLLLVEWAEKLGINKQTLYNRIFTYKWSIEKALIQPLMKNQFG